MQISEVKNFNPQTAPKQMSVVAAQARDINTTLKNSTTKIRKSIEDTKRAAQALKDAQTLDEDYKNALSTLEDIKNFSELFSNRAEFSVNKEINRVIIRIIDSNTNDTIKEIPSAEMQHIQKRIKDLLSLLFDTSTSTAENQSQTQESSNKTAHNETVLITHTK